MYKNSSKKQADQTANPSKYPQGYFHKKKCRWCGTLFKPKAPSHLYCSDECKDHGNSDKYLKRNYRISYEQFMELYNKQNGRCAICGGVGFKINPHGTFLLAVDHDHTTGKVRGLLCHNCNRALGLFQDHTDTLAAAIKYLEGATTIP